MDRVKALLTLKEKKKIRTLIKEKWVTMLISVLMILLMVATLSILLYRQREVLLTYEWKINLIPFVAALGLHAVALLLGSATWASILNSLGPHLSFWQHFRMFCMNMVARRLPGTVWYVVYRAQTYKRYGFSIQLTSLASGVELAVAVISGVITAILFAFSILQRLNLNPWLLVAFSLLGLGFLHPRFLRWLMTKTGARSAQLSAGLLIKLVVMYILLWICGGVILYLIANIFIPLPVASIIYCIGAWALVGTVSQALLFLPSNFGFSEMSLSLLLTQLMPSSIAVIVAIFSRVIFILFEIFWSVLTLLLLKVEK